MFDRVEYKSFGQEDTRATTRPCHETMFNYKKKDSKIHGLGQARVIGRIDMDYF